MRNTIRKIYLALKANKQSIHLSNHILIGVHHKTGTVWLGSIFKHICSLYDIEYYQSLPEKLPNAFSVLLHNHSQFDFNSILQSFRGLHMIRDPRDIIISGCFYHQKSREKWLHCPREEFGGLTYQQKINSFGSLDEKILFEIENCGSWTIHEMLDWNYSREEFLEIKYEDLIVDDDLARFHEIFTFLGFPGYSIPTLLSITYNKSLFSGSQKKSMHIRSGKSQQWKQYFKSIHKEKFLTLFGDALIQLGYEEDHDWFVRE